MRSCYAAGSKMAEIFISFIHEESGYAEALKHFLTEVFSYKIMPFMASDKLQVYAGEKWIDRIMEELANARVVLLMLSEKSVLRPWVNFEAGAAWTREAVIIPVCYEGLKKGELPKPYSSLQAVDLTVRGDDEYLVSSIAHHLKVEEPISYFMARVPALLALDEDKCKSIVSAYEGFRERLERLREDPTGRSWDFS